MKPFFSIAIPTYEMHDYGEKFLRHNFNILNDQTFKDFEIIISDHSVDDVIQNCVRFWVESTKLNITYIRNEYKRGGSSPNINNAMRHSNGKWIKILFQDDFLYSNDSLKELKDHIDNSDKAWVASACEHSNDGKNMYRPFYPTWANDIHFGNNKISSPSVITFKNTDNNLYFDEDLIWLMDVEYYKRMYDKYGEPSYLNKINVVNRTWANRLTNTLSNERKNNEHELMRKRYD